MTKENEKKLAAELFRKTVGEVKKLQTGKVQPEKRQTNPAQIHKNHTTRCVDIGEHRISALQPEETLEYAQDGVQPKTLKKLRNGKLAIDAESDLHGLTAIEAQRVLVLLLTEAIDNNWRCIKIIHGKGMRSPDRGAVLKGLVDHFLRQQSTVLAFHSARQNAGGTGAVVVLLK